MRTQRKGYLLLAGRWGDTTAERSNPDLSACEIEILLHMREGATDKQIARDVALSERTVHHYVQAICKKLATANRTQAVVTALRRQIISLE